MLVFTPPHSQMGLGSVVVRQRPRRPVSPAEYRGMLARRIQEMVDAAEPKEARLLLGELARQEGITLSLRSAGEMLAEHSQTLREMASYPVVPIRPEQFDDDSETADSIADEVLEEWVMMLLR